MSKYVKIDDVMALINTSNRGNCDYFIVDKIEELCNSNSIYDIDKVDTITVKRDDFTDDLLNMGYTKGYGEGYKQAIDDLLKQVKFEEKWLYDVGLRYCDITVAFNGIYKEAERLLNCIL